MDRDGVVDDRGHAGVLELLLEPVAAAGLRQAEVGAVGGGGAAAAAGGLAAGAAGDPHHELVPAVPRRPGLRQLDALQIGQGPVVGGGDAAAALDPALQVGQLDVQHRRLHGIETAVVAEGRVQIAARHAMHRQLPHRLGHGGIAAGHGATVAGGAEVLGGEEAEAARIAPAAHRLPGPLGTGGLGAILDHPQAVAAGDGADPLHVHRAAEQMHRHQGTGGGCDRRLDLIQIDQIGVRVHVHEHGRGAHGADRLGGGEEAEGAGDHLVAGADAQGPQRQDQGIGAAVAAHCVGHAAGPGEGLLEAGDAGAADVLATAQNLQYGSVEFLPEVLELLAETEGRHLHGGHLKASSSLQEPRLRGLQRAQAGSWPGGHLMLQPIEAVCSGATGRPASSASMAARRSRPSRGTALPGRLPSSWPR